MTKTHISHSSKITLEARNAFRFIRGTSSQEEYAAKANSSEFPSANRGNILHITPKDISRLEDPLGSISPARALFIIKACTGYTSFEALIEAAKEQGYDPHQWRERIKNPSITPELRKAFRAMRGTLTLEEFAEQADTSLGDRNISYHKDTITAYDVENFENPNSSISLERALFLIKACTGYDSADELIEAAANLEQHTGRLRLQRQQEKKPDFEAMCAAIKICHARNIHYETDGGKYKQLLEAKTSGKGLERFIEALGFTSAQEMIDHAHTLFDPQAKVALHEYEARRLSLFRREYFANLSALGLDIENTDLLLIERGKPVTLHKLFDYLDALAKHPRFVREFPDEGVDVIKELFRNDVALPKPLRIEKRQQEIGTYR